MGILKTNVSGGGGRTGKSTEHRIKQNECG